MAFVNELISDEDKGIFYSFNFKNPVTGDPVEARKWTIDRERDVFLVGLGGQGLERSEIPAFYALVWKKNVIMIETFYKDRGQYYSDIEIWWKITRVEIPESLKPDQEIIIELIKEALSAYGPGFDGSNVIRVNFDMIAEPVFVREVK